jgi:hypothetical protein
MPAVATIAISLDRMRVLVVVAWYADSAICQSRSCIWPWRHSCTGKASAACNSPIASLSWTLFVCDSSLDWVEYEPGPEIRLLCYSFVIFLLLQFSCFFFFVFFYFFHVILTFISYLIGFSHSAGDLDWNAIAAQVLQQSSGTPMSAEALSGPGLLKQLIFRTRSRHPQCLRNREIIDLYLIEMCGLTDADGNVCGKKSNRDNNVILNCNLLMDWISSYS